MFLFNTPLDVAVSLSLMVSNIDNKYVIISITHYYSDLEMTDIAGSRVTVQLSATHTP